jgi:hypothetical protein
VTPRRFRAYDVRFDAPNVPRRPVRRTHQTATIEYFRAALGALKRGETLTVTATYTGDEEIPPQGYRGLADATETAEDTEGDADG